MKLTPLIIQKRVQDFTSRCRREGLSLTHQRMAVYSRLAATAAHPTAEELYADIRREYPTVSLATVYKTLETFERHGMVSKSRSTGEKARFDANLEPHHHLICKVCGKMEDVFETVTIPRQSSPDFTVEDIRIDFRGICGKCRPGKIRTKST